MAQRQAVTRRVAIRYRSASTIDRRLAPDRKKQISGRSRTKPGTLLKAQIPIRTWSEWDEAEPGFVEIDCVGHEGGVPSGDFCQTLTVTDIHTRWTKTAAVREQGSEVGGRGPGRPLYLLPSRVRGIDSHNGSDLINNHRFRHCETGKTTPYLDRTA